MTFALMLDSIWGNKRLSIGSDPDHIPNLEFKIMLSLGTGIWTNECPSNLLLQRDMPWATTTVYHIVPDSCMENKWKKSTHPCPSPGVSSPSPYIPTKKFFPLHSILTYYQLLVSLSNRVLDKKLSRVLKLKKARLVQPYSLQSTLMCHVYEPSKVRQNRIKDLLGQKDPIHQSQNAKTFTY